MIEFLKILLFFIIPSNILLLFLCRTGLIDRFKKAVIFCFGYGVAPFLNSLIFYYLIWFFPEREKSFYLIILAIFWLMLFLFGIKGFGNLRRNYQEIIFSLASKWREIKKSKLVVLLALVVLFIGLSTIQSLFYPIIGGDEVLYLNQSEALKEERNLDWRKAHHVIIRGDDQYSYNSMIRPGIPSLMALNLFVSDKNYFIFKFLSCYYYLLLITVFLILIKKVAHELKKDHVPAIIFGMLFLVFSWTITRSYIFNSKEIIIYFFALLGIIFAIDLIKKERCFINSLFLGIILGVNSFLNFHGIVIGLITTLIVLIFAKNGIRGRLKTGLIIFPTFILFGGTEFIKSFSFIFSRTFLATVEFFKNKLFSKFQIDEVNQVLPEDIKPEDIKKDELSYLNDDHKALYKISDKKSLYLRGKLQMVTNVGVFGYYFWGFLVTIILKFKKILKSEAGRVMVVFIFVYLLIVLDVFNLNKHEYSIILCGSTKYASLLTLLSLVVLSAYIKSFGEKIIRFLFRKRKFFSLLAGSFFFIMLVNKEYFVHKGTDILLATIRDFKDVSFYQDKIDLFYNVVLVFLFGLIISVWIKKWSSRIGDGTICLLLVLFFVLTPFFITNVGKISWRNSLKYIGSDLETKLTNTSNDTRDIFKVYFYAKQMLPFQSTMSGPNEIYTYDNYFRLVMKNRGEPQYIITKTAKKCKASFSRVYQSGDYVLCKKK